MSILRTLENKRREYGFTGNMLKVVAMLTMLIDHIGVMLIYNGKLYGYDMSLYQNAISLPEAETWLVLYRLCRVIGRISFPIFAFLIVEGFRKSNNIFKYINRLAFLAIISEIPFDLILYNKPICFDTQNVIFTYIVGLLMLISIRYTKNFPIIIHILFAFIASAICYFLKTDYAIEGILLMFVYYAFRHDLNVKCFFMIVITFIYTVKINFGAGILAVPFIYLYDGRRGYMDMKRISYVFYPAHLIILYLIVYFSYIY